MFTLIPLEDLLWKGLPGLVVLCEAVQRPPVIAPVLHKLQIEKGLRMRAGGRWGEITSRQLSYARLRRQLDGVPLDATDARHQPLVDLGQHVLHGGEGQRKGGGGGCFWIEGTGGWDKSRGLLKPKSERETTYNDE